MVLSATAVLSKRSPERNPGFRTYVSKKHDICVPRLSHPEIIDTGPVAISLGRCVRLGGFLGSLG
eukprot:1341523-Amorphochlora_amoeboformis.AAC.1